MLTKIFMLAFNNKIAKTAADVEIAWRVIFYTANVGWSWIPDHLYLRLFELEQLQYCVAWSQKLCR